MIVSKDASEPEFQVIPINDTPKLEGHLQNNKGAIGSVTTLKEYFADKNIVPSREILDFQNIRATEDTKQLNVSAI